MKANLIPLFVYGTLRLGHGACERFGLAPCEVRQNVSLFGYQLFDLGAFPGIIQGPGNVIGDVFFVPEDRFGALDRYEGVPHLYTRQTVTIDDIEGVQVYVYNGNLSTSPLIENGDWNDQSRRQA